jgi:phage terminase small subunit
MKKLTIRQENFCNYYIELGDASKAYRRAYNADKMKTETINNKAYKLLNRGDIGARLEELQAELKSKSDITKEQNLKELANIAFSSIADLHKTWIERKDFEDLTVAQKAAIKSISTKVLKKNIGTHDNPEIVDVEYVKVEMHDKLKALDSINRILGFYAPEKMDVSVTTPVRINIIRDNGRNNNKLN